MKRILLFILSILSLIYVQAQCTQVNEDGSVTIILTFTVDCALYIIEDENVSTWITNIEDGQTTYTTNIFNANNGPVSYLLACEMYYNAPITTIFATAVQQDANSILVMSSANTAGIHNVYRKRPSLNEDWILIGQTDASARFTDDVQSICRDTIYYRLERENSGCSSISNIAKVVVGDIEIPDPPEISMATIDLQTQKYELHWQPSTSEDVLGYLICKGNPCVTLDTVWGKETDFYVYESCDILEENSLAVMAFDTCMNTSLRTDRLTNMVLKVDRFNCSNEVTFSWNEVEYVPLCNTPYEIYMKQGNGNYTLLTRALSSPVTVNIPATSGEMSFYVRTTSKDDANVFAYSNVVKIEQNTADTLDFVIMRTASVNADNKSVTVRAYVDNTKQNKDFKLYRAEDNGMFSLVAEQQYNGDEIIEFTDYIGDKLPNHTYTYYVEASDVCGINYTRSSNKVTTMKLSIEEMSFSENKISWTPFNAWQVGSYDVYRYPEGEQNASTYVGTTSSNVLIDDISQLLSAADRIFYYVSATQSSAGPDSRIETANSSQNYIQKETIFFIPNAFSPTDGNEEINTFKPACHFVRAGTYDMRIYNRWGEMLFSTNDADEGWNGKYKGAFCPIGVYTYVIQFINSEGKIEKHAGTFMLCD